jgi:hypothetical protein
MKRLILFFCIFLPVFSIAQVNESFSDGNFDQNPEWNGNTSSFVVNTSFQLQSSAAATSVSYLSTPSNAFVNASWECWVKINYTTSSSNYACFYIASDAGEITNECNAYYVQIGGTNDEVSLFVLQNGTKTKIIDGTDKRTDGNPVSIQVKVTSDAQGNFTLYSKTASEQEYYEEGTVNNKQITKSDYIALLYSNTSTTGKAYYFDDILVTGAKALDTIPPLCQSIRVQMPDQIVLGFNEAIDIQNANFEVSSSIGQANKAELSTDKKTVTLTFNNYFEKGIIYGLTITGLTDIEGNALVENTKKTAIIETPVVGDLVINEIMFNAPENSAEYVEIINLSGKVIDLSGFKITTRKSNGSLNNGETIPAGSFIAPNSCVAMTPYAKIVSEYHQCPVEAELVNMPSWSTLNNESATLVFVNAGADTIFDEVTYSEKWHNSMIKNVQGVSLERVHPQLASDDKNSWHSAASEVNYGTPGYKNSQYRDIYTSGNTEKLVWIEPEAFSPDNDGNYDQCLIHYKTPAQGYTAKAIILNATGVVVKDFFTNYLLSSEGMIIWDGSDNKGNTIQPGIYVFYFEMINVNSGDKKIYKLPVVVSSR